MKAIIWDMDGTITDSEQFWTANPFRMLEHFGVPDPRGKSAPWFKTHYSESIKAYLESPDCKINMTYEECIIWGKNYAHEAQCERVVGSRKGAEHPDVPAFRDRAAGTQIYAFPE